MKSERPIGTSARRAQVLIVGVIATLIAASIHVGITSAERNTTMKQIRKSDDEWKLRLSKEQYRILREQGTEAPFTGKYWSHNEKGEYRCAACDNLLFESDEKFDSKCGWPSFSNARKGSVRELPDHSAGMTRTEIRCSKCDGHLGHLFNDGPQPTGLRYCINSAALDFSDSHPNTETATLGSGCFWCTEATLASLNGVISVTVGYTGGKTADPTYKEVCSGNTGHAEVARILFDPTRLSYSKLLETFWKIHDPTSLNSQGADKGTQYRSAIFFHSKQQETAAGESLAKQQQQLTGQIVTEILPASKFYPAENYHQDYYRNNPDAPYCQNVIAPKLRKLKKAAISSKGGK